MSLLVLVVCVLNVFLVMLCDVLLLFVVCV